MRLETFDYRWPSTRVRATPPQIAKAGFYFLGERDRVKCWYCNGGLQNWEPMDEPWREHAKWFPTYVALGILFYSILIALDESLIENIKMKPN